MELLFYAGSRLLVYVKMLRDSISNVRSLLLAVSRVERGKETRHTRTSIGSHHLRVVADVPSRVLHKEIHSQAA